MKYNFVNFGKYISQKLPFTRGIMLAVYGFFRRNRWMARNIFTGFRPIQVLMKNDSILMCAEGNIAKVLWEYDFEKLERSIVYQFFKKDIKVVNVGANSGLYTLMAGKAAGPNGEIHAFEPASISYKRLVKNIRLNKLTNVTANQSAVSNFSGFLEVCRDPSNPDLDGHFTTRSDGQGGSDVIEKVPSITLDEYWNQKHNTTFQPVDLIIIDVEGFEINILRGAVKTLANSPDLIMMLECTENIEESNSLLGGMGFGFYVWDEHLEKLKKNHKIEHGNNFVSRKNLL